ncbi:MAG: 50S ribosomal protein L10 [Bacilli bacterium]
MASAKVIDTKKAIVAEIQDYVKNSESVIIFTYQGMTVADLSDLRRKLRDVESEIKIYKNTLVRRALDDLNIDLSEFLEGPNAILFGKDLLEPIKILSEFAKTNDKMDIRVGIISGKPADIEEIKSYASIPSRDGLLTMLAGGMIQYVRDLSIGLNLYAESLEK